MKKFVTNRAFADADVAARKLVEIANGVEPVQDGRIYIERVNAPFLAARGSRQEFRNCASRAAMPVLPRGVLTLRTVLHGLAFGFDLF